MDLDTLAKLGEFVGGVFVFVSVIYLAYQVRQNTRTLRTENYARVLERMSTMQSRIAVDADLNHIVIIGSREPNRLSPMERIRFNWAMYELLGAGEFMFHQSRDDALPAEIWERWQGTIRWWLSYPGVRAWWQAKPVRLATDFEAFVNQLIAEPSDPAQFSKWDEFIIGEAKG